MAFPPHSVLGLTVVLEVINRQIDKLKIQKFNLVSVRDAFNICAFEIIYQALKSFLKSMKYINLFCKPERVPEL